MPKDTYVLYTIEQQMSHRNTGGKCPDVTDVSPFWALGHQSLVLYLLSSAVLEGAAEGCEIYATFKNLLKGIKIIKTLLLEGAFFSFL